MNKGECSPDGRIFCRDAEDDGDEEGKEGRVILVCDQGGLIDLGRMARGTKCVEGRIVVDDGY